MVHRFSIKSYQDPTRFQMAEPFPGTLSGNLFWDLAKQLLGIRERCPGSQDGLSTRFPGSQDCLPHELFNDLFDQLFENFALYTLYKGSIGALSSFPK